MQAVPGAVPRGGESYANTVARSINEFNATACRVDKETLPAAAPRTVATTGYVQSAVITADTLKMTLYNKFQVHLARVPPFLSASRLMAQPPSLDATGGVAPKWDGVQVLLYQLVGTSTASDLTNSSRSQGGRQSKLCSMVTTDQSHKCVMDMLRLFLHDVRSTENGPLDNVGGPLHDLDGKPHLINLDGCPQQRLGVCWALNNMPFLKYVERVEADLERWCVHVDKVIVRLYGADSVKFRVVVKEHAEVRIE